MEKNECWGIQYVSGDWKMAWFWYSEVVHIHLELTELLALPIGQLSDIVLTLVVVALEGAMVPLGEHWDWEEAKNGIWGMPVFNENSVFSSAAFICCMFLVLIERLQKLNSTSLFDSVRHHFETELWPLLWYSWLDLE